MPARQLREDYEYIYEEKPVRVEVPVPKREERTRINTHLRSRCLVLLVVLSLMAVVTTVRSSMSAARGYELVQVQQQAAQLEQENKSLQVEIARLKAPQRIKDIAAKDLGMSVPQEVYFASDKK
jgi:cell division protein FtsL